MSNKKTKTDYKKIKISDGMTFAEIFNQIGHYTVPEYRDRLLKMTVALSAIPITLDEKDILDVINKIIYKPLNKIDYKNFGLLNPTTDLQELFKAVSSEVCSECFKIQKITILQVLNNCGSSDTNWSNVIFETIVRYIDEHEKNLKSVSESVISKKIDDVLNEPRSDIVDTFHNSKDIVKSISAIVDRIILPKLRKLK